MKIQARNIKTLRLVELEFPTMMDAVRANPGFTNFEKRCY